MSTYFLANLKGKKDLHRNIKYICSVDVTGCNLNKEELDKINLITGNKEYISIIDAINKISNEGYELISLTPHVDGIGVALNETGWGYMCVFNKK